MGDRVYFHLFGGKGLVGTCGAYFLFIYLMKTIQEHVSVLILAVLLVILGFIIKEQAFRKVGLRYTYCDGLRHLVYEHHEDIDLTECESKPLTDIEKKLGR